jgi:transcriptional regulator GlxA family with amidase domain
MSKSTEHSVMEVAILVYDDAEVLDFSGPFEVFSVTTLPDGSAPFNVSLIATEMHEIQAINGMKVVPNETIKTLPRPDILVIAGGSGSRQQMDNTHLITWIQDVYESAKLVMSVCSGARLLAVAGLLDGLKVTTHHQVFDNLQELAPKAILCPHERFTDNGKIITSAGISAGIDVSFYVVEKLLGTEVARQTAAYVEYDWQPAKQVVDT